MSLWLCSFLVLWFSVESAIPPIFQQITLAMSSFSREKVIYLEAQNVFQLLQESLEAGLIPQDSVWLKLQNLRAPWSPWTGLLIQKLRSQGVALLPTLTRLRRLAHESLQDMIDARAKTGQATAQAWIAGALIPILGVLLRLLLPELEKHAVLWWLGVGMAIVLAGVGALWMAKLGFEARFLGLKGQERLMLFQSAAAIEQILALIQGGMPPDLAWAQATGEAVWKDEKPQNYKNEAKNLILHAMHEIKTTIQMSVIEGRSCTDRIQSSADRLRGALRGESSRQVQLLGTRVLQPLFLCVAPAAFSVLVWAMFLASDTWLLN